VSDFDGTRYDSSGGYEIPPVTDRKATDRVCVGRVTFVNPLSRSCQSACRCDRCGQQNESGFSYRMTPIGGFNYDAKCFCSNGCQWIACGMIGDCDAPSESARALGWCDINRTWWERSGMSEPCSLHRGEQQ